MPPQRGLDSGLMNLPYLPPIKSAASLVYADTFYKSIEKAVTEARKGLASDEVLFIYCYDGDEVITVHDIGYYNPMLLTIHGESNGEECTVLAHVNTVQLFMRKVKKDLAKSVRNIGFIGTKDS